MLNDIGGIPFPDHLWNGPQIIGWFFLFSCLVIVSVSFAAKCIKIFAIKFKISPTFIGGVVLSTFTSLPEFFTSIYAGVSDRLTNLPEKTLFSFFNITGANAVQIFILSIFGFSLFLIYFKNKEQFRSKLDRIKQSVVFLPFKTISNYYYSSISSKTSETTNELINKNQKLNQFYLSNWNPIIQVNFILWLITLIEYLLILLFLLVPSWGEVFSVNGFSFINFLFFLSWLTYSIYTYKFNPESEDLYSPSLTKTWAWKINPYFLIFFIIFFSASLAFFAYLNSGIVNRSEVIGIPKSAAASFFLSIATSLPEITLFITLCRKRLFATAGASILGSSVFNLSIPFYSNLISFNPLYGNNFAKLLNDPSIDNQDAKRLIPWMGFSIILYVLLATSASRPSCKRSWLSTNLIFLMMIGYIVGFVLISKLIN
ncbi:Sodium:calcium exchanger family protein [[Mycoplasma] cavipharyngis]|uniref:hypothetical protein n=1 Tax=[Mycoplasma] cavipharyngis TaxID=92757 RepID=UPI003703CBCB